MDLDRELADLDRRRRVLDGHRPLALAVVGRLLPTIAADARMRPGDALAYLEGRFDQVTPVTEQALRSIHALVLPQPNPEVAGRYRTVDVFIAGSRHVPPPPAAIPALMGRLMQWLDATEQADRLAVPLAAEFHARMVAIHPFEDGNGRTARLAANRLLIRHGHSPASWRPEDRPAYQQALRAADLAGDHGPITLLTARAVARTFDLCLRVIASSGS